MEPSLVRKASSSYLNFSWYFSQSLSGHLKVDLKRLEKPAEIVGTWVQTDNTGECVTFVVWCNRVDAPDRCASLLSKLVEQACCCCCMASKLDLLMRIPTAVWGRESGAALVAGPGRRWARLAMLYRCCDKEAGHNFGLIYEVEGLENLAISSLEPSRKSSALISHPRIQR